MNCESVLNLEDGFADCPHPFVDGPGIQIVYEIAQYADCPRQLVHEEIMIPAQSLDSLLSLIPSGRNSLIIWNLAQSIYDRRKKMEMFGAYMNRQPRPEQIQTGMAGPDIAGVQSLPKSAQYFIESGVIVR